MVMLSMMSSKAKRYQRQWGDAPLITFLPYNYCARTNLFRRLWKIVMLFARDGNYALQNAMQDGE
jgi:hypothetical protein